MNAKISGSLRAGAATLAAAATLLFATPALACGGFFCNRNAPVDQAGEKILFAVEGTTVTAHIQIQYTGPSEDFSWVLPLPAVPEFKAGTDELFRALHAATDPRFEIQWNNAEGCDYTNGCQFYAEASAGAGGAPNQRDGDVQVLAEGEVGPYDFKVIAGGSGQDVLDWLNENGYDQPEETAPILDHYTGLEYVFVALKLQKDKEDGDIQPLVVVYDAPSLACIPMRLTRVAAVDDMPVYSWVLGSARAIPLNYFHVLLNARKYDWLNCATPVVGEDGGWFGGGFSNGTDCNQVYRDLVSEAADTANGQAFVTEFAGRSEVMDGAVYTEGRYNLESLRSREDAATFIQEMMNQGFASSSLIQQIIRTHVPKPADEDLPQDCQGEQSFYAIWNLENCLQHMPEDWTFDGAAFADDLDERIVQPLQDAQALIDNNPYMTRMFTTMSPEEMTRDPFFSFNPDLPDVNHVHRVQGTAECKAGSTTVAERITLTFGDGSTQVLEGEFESCDFEILPTDGLRGGEPAAAGIQVLNESGAPEAVEGDEVASRSVELDTRTPSPNQSSVPQNPDPVGGNTGTFGTPGAGSGGSGGSGGGTTGGTTGGSDDGGGCAAGGSGLGLAGLASLLLGLRRRREEAV